MRLLLAIHAILLVLAASDFTAVTYFFGDHSVKWCFYQYASSNSFGQTFTSNYSVLMTLNYFLAFAAGMIGFFAASQRGRPVVGALGFVLSSLGLVSFAIEGSHWFLEHNRSWLAFSPAAMLVLVVLAVLPRPSRTRLQPTGK